MIVAVTQPWNVDFLGKDDESKRSPKCGTTQISYNFLNQTQTYSSPNVMVSTTTHYCCGCIQKMSWRFPGLLFVEDPPGSNDDSSMGCLDCKRNKSIWWDNWWRRQRQKPKIIGGRGGGASRLAAKFLETQSGRGKRQNFEVLET